MGKVLPWWEVNNGNFQHDNELCVRQPCRKCRRKSNKPRRSTRKWKRNERG
jgi:hypothetical protein